MVFLWLFYSTTSEHGVDVGGTPRHAPSIQRIRALFGEKGEESPACHPESLREGWLHCKVTAVEGKVKRYSIHATTSDPFFVSLNTFSASCQHSNILDYNCSLYFSISHVSLKKNLSWEKKWENSVNHYDIPLLEFFYFYQSFSTFSIASFGGVKMCTFF